MNDHGQILRVLALSAIVLTLVVLSGVWQPGANSVIACGLAGGLFIHLGLRPDRKEVISALSVGAIYGLVYYVLSAPFRGDLLSAILTVGAFAGLGSMTMLAYRALWFRSEPEINAARDAVILPLFIAGAGIVVGLLSNLWPRTLDLYLYAFDGSLGISPGPTVAGWWNQFPLLGILSKVTYSGLLLFPPLYRAWAMRKGVGREPSVLRSFLVAGLLGFVFFQFCPAIGPRYFFGERFPNHMPPLSDLFLDLPAVSGARNAIPSLYATWALLVWWSAWRLDWWARGIATLLVIFMGLAALGTGEHYLIDLVVAFPLALGVDGLCRRRQTAVAVGFGLTLAWLFLLRTGFHAPTPEIGWTFVAITVLASVICQIPLYRGKHTDEGVALSSRLSDMSTGRLLHEHER